MNLLHPTSGQRLDRLSILTLKLAHSEDPDQRLVFVAEQAALLATLPEKHTAVASLYRSLHAVNARLWQHQAEVAAVAALVDPPPNQLGVILFRLNQRRVGLIEEIDQILGEYLGPEKVYR
jgi:hypothetical protein